MIEMLPEIEYPLYSIRRFNDQIYKIVKFKGNRAFNFMYHGRVEEDDSSDETVSVDEKERRQREKLQASYSRAKTVILDLALCNPWQWFFTGTFNPEWWDRKNLPELNKKLKQWFRDRDKAYKKKGFSGDLSFLLIPEQHKDGSWHFHGLLFGIPDSHLFDFDSSKHPKKLCDKGYKLWDDFHNKFGFCSLSPIKDPTACAFYMTKYITKDMCSRKSDLGQHLYYCSQGLNRSVHWAEVYNNSSELDLYLTQKYDFCEVGFTKVSDGLDWTFPEYGIPLGLLPLFPEDQAETLSEYETAESAAIESFEQLYFPN